MRANISLATRTSPSAAGATLVTGVIDYIQQGGNTYVVADTSGDGKADFEVMIHGTFALNAGEFVL